MASLFRHAWVPLLLTPCRISFGSRRGVRGLRRKPLRVLPSVAEAQEKQRIVPSKVKAPYIPKAPPKERQPEPEPKEAELRYERAEPNEKRLRNLVTLAKSRAFREKHGRILLEGRRLITDALEAGAVPQTIFFSLMENLKQLPAAKLKRATLVKVKYNEIKMWSDVITPQGLIGCVDAWEPKVLRAGMGAHFRIPIISNLEWEVVPNYLPTESCIHVAESGHGRLPEEAEQASPAQAGPWKPKSTTRTSHLAPTKGGEEEEEEEEANLLKLQPYYNPWMDASVAVVVGGETHGVSPEAKQLSERSGGKQLAIPVVPGVESLNSAMAASILLFEAKRQWLIKEGGVSGLQLKQ
ncbi:PREDICTED: rRNA methyltransferase 3, mitochondrial [Thamnophis sirtalis]|uniref:rRNA methyltransferase 3, mitochondrial n=1 Tax=Thamnophis sirtalis TaxID=35019 RepID=A0A6I9YCG3_9SAUR|nr:PREDICTED: rRNA methyltransferase 3, mitochondrial [Thamnophis sirtalis]